MKQHIHAFPKLKAKATALFAAAVCFLLMMSPALSWGQTVQWTPKGQTGSVESFARIDQCTGEPTSSIFVKFTNHSATTDYEVSYELIVADDPTFPPIKGTITVSANSSEAGDCNSAMFTELRLPGGSNITGVSQLTINFTTTHK